MPSFDPADYLGLAAGEAEALAVSQGWRVRVLAPGDLVTMDFRDDRLNLTQVGGVVTDVTVG